jgi:hypothetical protein
LHIVYCGLSLGFVEIGTSSAHQIELLYFVNVAMPKY